MNMMYLLLTLTFCTSPGNWGLYTILNDASSRQVVFAMDNNERITSFKLGGKIKNNVRKRNRRMASLLSNLGFSYNESEDTIVISVQYPEYGVSPLELDATSSRCELHLKREESFMKDFSSAAKDDSLNIILSDLKSIIDKKIIQLVSYNDTTALYKLYKAFAVKALELPPKRVYRIILQEGRVIESNAWYYSIEPSVTIKGKIKSGDSLEQLYRQIEETKIKIQRL